MRNQNDFLSPPPKVNPGSQIDRYDPQILQASVRKSYICKLAQKGGQKKDKNIDSIIEEDERNGMMRTVVKNNISKIVQEQKQMGDLTYQVLMTNLGTPKQKSLNCCQGREDKVIVEAIISEYKQLCIKNKQKKELYCFNFNTLKAEVVSEKQIPQLIMLKISENINLEFRQNENRLQFQKFRNRLKNIVEKGMGNSYEMADLLQKPGFEKVRYKPVTEFIEHCQTGDILLFQGSHFFANVQRTITNSEYDHVGMVIRDPVYGILIFQSNSTSGVCLTPWELLIKYKWYKYIERIVWRKLQEVERDKRFINLVHSFVSANLGKNYFISFQKLLSNQSYIAKKSQQVGFFCSELIAAVYKDLKLLTRNQKDPNFKPSCNFYPYHFTQKFKLSLTEGELSDQYIIHFDQKQIDEYYSF